MKPSPVEAALQRLNQSLARVEDAVERRLEGERGLAGREVEMQAVLDDRIRLANELDSAFARIHCLEEANREASKRLADAMDRIGNLLKADE